MQSLNESHQSQEAPKRMMRIERLPSGKTLVEINYSSLELLQTCHRKADYALNQQLKSSEEAPALAFGSSIHKALEHWYTLPIVERELADNLREKAELFAHGHDLETPTTGALESIRQFVVRAWPSLHSVDSSDKRSIANGIKLLRAYFKRYHDDQWVVATDDQGPLIERDVEFTMHEDAMVVIRYFGRIDVVLKNLQSGVIAVADHKTTSALGTEFYQRCKPNPQYTGYVWAARECLGLDTTMFMVNGIQVAKTKQEFARQITTRNEEDFAELKASTIKQVYSWLDSLKYREFPQSAPNPCTMYGGCPYRMICEVPDKLKPSVIASKWPQVNMTT